MPACQLCALRTSAARTSRCGSSAQEDALQRPQVFMQWPQGLSPVGLVMKACPQLPHPACETACCQSKTLPELSGLHMLERPPTAD